MTADFSKTTLSTLLRLAPVAAVCFWPQLASAQNLLENSTFDATAISPWWPHADENAMAVQTVEVVEGRMCSTVVEGEQGENPWDIIIGYSEIPLLPNQYYHVTVTASASTDREIRVKTGLGEAPYTDYILQKLKVTTTPQAFTFTYLNIRDDPAAQVQFHIGGHTGQLCLDDIVLEPVAAPVEPVHVTPSLTGMPLKAYSELVKMGTAVDTPIFLTSPLHNSIVAGEFSMITPANSMKMNNIQPTEGVFDFTDTDALYNWATAKGLEFRGHPLVWHTQAPGWVVDDTTLTRDPMIAIMNTHITTLIGKYPSLPYWDVVNEAIDNVDGVWTFRPTFWHDRIGPDFIDIAFQTARAAAPTAKLVYNDYNIEQLGNAKADRVFELVSDMKTRGIPIDAIGFQSHYYVEPDGNTASGVPNMQAIRENMARYEGIGVEVHVTECDFRIGTPTDDAKQQMQSKFYADLLQTCIDAPNCSQYTVWGLSDVDSWVPGTFPDYDYAHIFDASFVAKPAYQAMTQAFSAYDPDGPVDGTGGTDEDSASSGGCTFQPAGLGERLPWQAALAGALGLFVWTRRTSRKSSESRRI
jgi:GH35 family endo-1,4-beta-xylanase